MKSKGTLISCLTEFFLSLFLLFCPLLPSLMSLLYSHKFCLCISIMANKLKKAHFLLKITFNGSLWGQKDVHII